MLTDTGPSPANARRFLLRGIAASLGIFGLLRLPWIAAHVVLPFTRLQASAATSLIGTPSAPIEATLACSGADAMALFLGAIVAYPAAWSVRVAGALVGAALIIGLNTVRIGTLGLAAASPPWFTTLHVYLWPLVLSLAIVGYVLAWMRFADRRRAFPLVGSPLAPSGRFVLLTVIFLLLFSTVASLYQESGPMLATAGFIANSAAVSLDAVGIAAHAEGNILWTRGNGFLVAGECVATPLIPIYLAAVGAYALTWPRMLLGALAAAPLFIALGVARLLVVALPDVVGSPLFFVHAFYQLLLGAIAVVVAALWRHGRGRAVGPALTGVLAGSLCIGVMAPVSAHVLIWRSATPPLDPQGTLALLPAFQWGLYLALCVAAFLGRDWRRLLAGFALLVLTQAAAALALSIYTGHNAMTVDAVDVRGWAVAGPVLTFALAVNRAWSRR